MNVSAIRRGNQEMILRELHMVDKTSRTELANKLNLSKPAISDNLVSLLKCGIIKEAGEEKPTQNGGRRLQILKFNHQYCYIIAIDLNYKVPIFVLSDLKNNIKHEFEIKVSDMVNEEVQISIIEHGIHLLLNAGGVSKKEVFCIAIASPGVFDEDGKLVSSNPRFTGIDWNKFNFKERLTKVFGIKIIIMNDINAAGLGEWLSEPQTQNFLLISCGNGIGSSLILDGMLYEGRNKTVGEIYNYVDMQKSKNGKTLEENICIQSLIEKCKKSMINGSKTCIKLEENESLDFETISLAYMQEDKMVCNIVKEICDELCIMICNYVNFIPVEKVILCGDYVIFGEMFKQRFEHKFSKYCHTAPKIVVSSADKHNGIYGVLSRARDLLFKEIVAS